MDGCPACVPIGCQGFSYLNKKDNGGIYREVGGTSTVGAWPVFRPGVASDTCTLGHNGTHSLAGWG